MTKKTIEMTQDGFRTVWRNGEPSMIDVDVFRDGADKPCLEWSYGKVAGTSILGNASFWLPQVIAQARLTGKR